MTTFVGIHGSWFGGWYWNEVARLVEEQGHRAAPIDRLPSGGTDPKRMGDLRDDAQHVRRHLDALEGPLTLVGHSYSGMVVAELADHPAVQHSIYVSAFWPQAGLSALDLAGGPLPDWMSTRDDGTVELSRDMETVWRALFSELDEDRARFAYQRIAPQLMSLAALQTPSAAPERTHPVTYVVCENDQATPPPAQQAMARRADRVVRLSSSHCPMLVAPAKLAEVIVATLPSPAEPARAAQ